MNYLQVQVDNANVLGFMLAHAAPDFCDELRTSISEELSPAFAVQVSQLFFPLQKITGSARKFSCAVFPIPRMGLEERAKLPYLEQPVLRVNLSSANVELMSDGFQKIEALTVEGRPDLYETLLRASLSGKA